MSSDASDSDEKPEASYEPTVVVPTDASGERRPPKRRKPWLKGLFARREKSPDRGRDRPAAARPARVALPEEGERFERAGTLGRGGMATVELQLDNALRRKTAMKLLLPAMQSQEQVVRSFLREAQVTGQLAHPNIVPVYDLGTTDDDHWFFTMQRLDALTLTDVVRDLPPRALERGQLLDLLEIVIKVCNALAFAHKRGVIHRDVKPDNVMVGDFGQVYLVDWGLARLSDQNEQAAENRVDPVSSSYRNIWQGRIIGTPGFMPPEQASGGEVDERSDVFALGALLYFLLARRPPYEGGSSEEVIERAQRCEFKPLSEAAVGGSAPRELDRIIGKALSRRPADRQQSAVELRQEIVAFTRGGSLPRVRFESGAEILSEGESGEHAYIIVSGRCEVLKQIDGERRSIRTIGPGECFGETAVMTSAPRTASVVALEDTLVERVNREELLEELDAMKPWVSVFLRSLAELFQERETAGS